MKWSVGIVAFFLPTLVEVIGTYIERLPSMYGRSNEALDLFVLGASVLLAAVVSAVFIMTAPTTLARRLGFTAAVWCLLLLEVYILFIWALYDVGVL
jgi:uncharacterized membrane protein YecN with MAPEG domain